MTRTPAPPAEAQAALERLNQRLSAWHARVFAARHPVVVRRDNVIQFRSRGAQVVK